MSSLRDFFSVLRNFYRDFMPNGISSWSDKKVQTKTAAKIQTQESLLMAI